MEERCPDEDDVPCGELPGDRLLWGTHAQESCEVVARQVLAFLSTGRSIVTYPPLMLHTTRHFSLQKPPSDAVVLFETSGVPLNVGAGYGVTNEVMCYNGAGVQSVSCTAYINISDALDNHWGTVDVDTLKEAIVFSVMLYDRKEITEDDMRVLHRRFQEHFMYPVVLVRVARIIDSALWPKLFTVTPPPLTIFDAVLQASFVNEAAVFIRVVDVMQGREVALQSVIRLMRRIEPGLLHDVIHAVFHGQDLEDATAQEEHYAGEIGIFLEARLKQYLSDFNLEALFALLHDETPFILRHFPEARLDTGNFGLFYTRVQSFSKTHSPSEANQLGQLFLGRGLKALALMIGIHTQILPLLRFDGSREIFDDLEPRIRSCVAVSRAGRSTRR